MSVQVLHDDCRLALLQPFTVDAIITDPPYEMGFMSKDWDKTGIAYDVEMWKLCLQVLKPGGHLLSFGGSRTYHRMACAIEDAGFQIRDQIMWIYGSGFPKSLNLGHGWGTALKPAHEPIVLARKPLSEKTIVENVLKHGVGGINIDGCRVPTTEIKQNNSEFNASFWQVEGGHGKRWTGNGTNNPNGRFPANVIHDGGHEQLNKFFYCAKASTKERNGSKHPTVKPLALMRYLCRLITPPNGTILDPFAGSGTTGEAAQLEGFNAILIEQNEIYINDIYNRLNMESVKCQE